MIVKDRKMNDKVLVIQALLRRLPMNDPVRQELETELARRLTGYRGEQSLEYHLSFLPEKEYFILHDLRLSHGQYFFQIDTLILTSYFFVILEIKNISGTLMFDQSFNQLIRIINEKEDGFANPLLQVKMQHQQLASFLNLQTSLPPIESLVVISQPSTIVKTNTNDPQLFNKICHAAQVVDKINNYKLRYKKEVISLKDLRKLIRLLIKKHTPINENVLLQYKISKAKLMTGVLCSNCKTARLLYKKANWFCPKCNTVSKDAHLQAIKDYFLLFNPTITNRQLQAYFHLTSRNVSYKLLKSMNLSHSGNGKGRVYFSGTK